MLDQLVGLAMIGVASAVFLYYSTWVLVLPFVDDASVLHSFFLPRDYALKIPILLLVIGGIGVGSFIASVLIKENKKKQLKNRRGVDEPSGQLLQTQQ